MSNVKLLFGGTEQSKTEYHTIQLYSNTNNEIYINVEMGDRDSYSFICLDKATAIKLHRELKKQISFLND